MRTTTSALRATSLALITTAGLALGACSSDDDGAAKTGGGSATAAAKVTPLTETADTTLAPGRYETTAFVPKLTLDIPGAADSTWRTLGPGQSANHFGLTALAGEPIRQTSLGVHVMDAVADPRRGARTKADAVEPPDDFIAWLSRHPHLRSGDPVDVEVGGVSGRQIDVTPISRPERMPDECSEGGIDCVPLFFDQEEPIVYPLRSKVRFIGLDVGDQQVVVEEFSDPDDQFDRVMTLLDPVLQSISFESAG